MTLALHRDFDQTAAPVTEPPALTRPAYGSSGWQRPNWLVVALIVALHVAGLAALVALDVVPLPKLRRGPVVVELIPEALAPPPKPARPSAAHEVEVPVASPPPIIVSTPVVPVATAPAIVVPPPTPGPPAPAAPAVVAAAPPAPPAPVIPPDVDAATGRNIPPDYPIESRRRREQGTVRLRVVITPDGRVKTIEVARSSGFDRLDQAALRAVRAWLFRPGTQAGVAVEAVGALSIPFRLT